MMWQVSTQVINIGKKAEISPGGLISGLISPENHAPTSQRQLLPLFVLLISDILV